MDCAVYERHTGNSLYEPDRAVKERILSVAIVALPALVWLELLAETGGQRQPRLQCRRKRLFS